MRAHEPAGPWARCAPCDPLPEHETELGTWVEIQAMQGQFSQLRGAHAGGVEQLEYRAVPPMERVIRIGGLHEPLDLLSG